MTNLTNFKTNELSQNESSNLKGGAMTFCEWYINQRTSEGKKVNSGQLSKAMELDGILNSEGMDAALASGGQEFKNKYA